MLTSQNMTTQSMMTQPMKVIIMMMTHMATNLITPMITGTLIVFVDSVEDVIVDTMTLL